MPPRCKCWQADQGASHDARGDDEHVRHVARHGRPRPGTRWRAPRCTQADDRQHVATVHDGVGHHAERRTATGDGAQVHAACRPPPGSSSIERLAVDVLFVTMTSIMSPVMFSSSRSSTSSSPVPGRLEHLDERCPRARDGDRVPGPERVTDAASMTWPRLRQRSTKTRVPPAASKSRRFVPTQGESRLKV